MIRTIAAAGVMLVACALSPLRADEAMPLKGDYMLYPADEEAGMPPAMYITIGGDAARDLYEGLAAKAEEDGCQGGMTKWMDGGFCNLAEGQYSCSFGIDLKDSKFAWGQDC